MIVYFNDEVLYTKNNNMCEMAKSLDTPYTCPIKAGKSWFYPDIFHISIMYSLNEYHTAITIYLQTFP